MERLKRSWAKGYRLPENSVYVGNGSRWANPYEKICDPDEALFLYKRDLQAGLLDGSIDLTPLKGKDLVCWCELDSPFCHADVLLSKFDE